MATLSRDEIRGYAQRAGFTGNDLDIAVAVAFAESSGDPKSHNPVPPDDSYGLWQINMLGALGPDRRRRFGLQANTDLYDPATNARVAYGIFKGSGWKAWTTYTRGTYKQFYKKETADPESASTPEEAEEISTISSISSVGDNIFKGVSNLGGVLAALVFVVLGVVILLRNQIPVNKLAKVVAK